MSAGADATARGREALESALRAALAAVDAEHAVLRAFDHAGSQESRPRPDKAEPVHVLAMGKAAVPMARAAHERLGRASAAGLVVTKQGHGKGFDAWPVLETSHPVPDASCAVAGARVLEFASAVPSDARLLVLLSGGTSALVSKPVAGISVAELAATNQALLGCGAPIEEVNAVRKRLTEVSGGRLATAASGARRIDVWIVSDVLGDDLSSIASGPCSPDESDFEQAVAVLQSHAAWAAVPDTVRIFLARGAQEGRRDTPHYSDSVFDRVHSRIVARNADALEAGAVALEAAGASVVHVTGGLRGEAARVGVRLAHLASVVDSPSPVALVAGGETTVRLGDEVGVGGRNQELALAAALALESLQETQTCAPEVVLLAAGTDGSDGPTDAAGGLVDGASAKRIRARGLQPQRALERHDSMPVLDAGGDLVRTGPTGSNVMDLVFAWVESTLD